MNPAPDFDGIAPFDLHAPDVQRIPFVFNSPHSGRHYPQRFLKMTRLDETAIRRSEDSFVDELFACAVSLGAPLLTANFPRAYLDVNREAWELDPRMFHEPLPPFANIRSARVAGGLGTIPRLVGEGLDIYSGRLPIAEAIQRIDRIYRPYHTMLKTLMAQTRARFGRAVLIDCHSMPASVRVGDSGMRPDFIIGDRFGASTAPALTETAIALLNGMGYSVAHNKPYAGGFITEHYGKPARQAHALQIEVNRGLYMNERTMQKSSGFAQLVLDLAQFCDNLTASESGSVQPFPLAAE